MALKRTACILFGNLVLALGAAYFLIPSGMVSGATPGLALALNSLFSIPTTVALWALNIAFFLAGAIVMGRFFALTTLLGSFAYPMFFTFANKLASYTGPLTQDPFLCMVFAGLLFGVSIAFILRQGSSTGGTDIPALILQQKFGIPVSITLTVFDILAIAAQAYHAERSQVLYGLLFLLLYTVVLNQMLTQGRSRVQIQIISPAYDAINQLIQSRFHRGCTLYRIQGGFTRNDSYSIITIVDRRVLFRLREEILSIDPHAFIVVTRVSEVNGRGFSI